jgi:quercetin dioxygenase-like cupin family protein
MVRSGDTIVSRETGETFTFLKTAADTGGQLLVFQMRVAPGGGAIAAPVHIHPKSEERFTIQQGSISGELDGKPFTAQAGERITIPAGAPHTWRNTSDGPAEFLVEIEPALQMETIFENLCAQSQRGLLSPDGKMNLLRAAIELDTYQDNLYVAGVPIFAQKLVFAALAAIARLRGYPAALEYTDPGRQSTLFQSVRI